MLRVPSSTVSSRLRYSRFSQTLTAVRLPAEGPPTRMPSGVVAAVAEGRGAAGAYPLAAAGMAFLLLGEALLEFLHQLVPAELFQLGLFLGRQVLLHQHLQPFFGDVGFQAGDVGHALEVFAEGLVELVVVGFVLDQAGAGEEVEVVDRVFGDVLLQRFEQREELARRHRQLLGLEVEEEIDQHESRRW